MIKKCRKCLKDFETDTEKKQYCSNNCKVKEYRYNQRKRQINYLKMDYGINTDIKVVLPKRSKNKSVVVMLNDGLMRKYDTVILIYGGRKSVLKQATSK